VRALGWTILTLVFVDELLAMAAYGVWGHHVAGWPLAVLLPPVAMAVWWVFGSPKAPYRGPVRRPVVKTLVFSLAGVALWHAGHPGWAVALLVFSVLVNGLALLPFVRAMTAEQETAARAR
jgi:hypothetical protein